MERQPVTSSNLVSVGYEAGSETLKVEFKRQSVYQYYNVPQMLYEQLLQAPSIGKFFIANIRDQFPCAKL